MALSKLSILLVTFCFLIQLGEDGFLISSHGSTPDFLELVDADIEEEKKKKSNFENLVEQSSDSNEFFDQLIHIENYLFPYFLNVGTPLDLPPKLLAFL